jgi:hypothetical protein
MDDKDIIDKLPKKSDNKSDSSENTILEIEIEKINKEEKPSVLIKN